MMLIYTITVCLDSLYSSLLQFDNMGSHGTKVIVYNLWLNDEGITELNFDTDPKVVFLFYQFSFQLCVEIVLSHGESYSHMQDIRIAWDIKKIGTKPAWKRIQEEHIANRFRYSLRVCLTY